MRYDKKSILQQREKYFIFACKKQRGSTYFFVVEVKLDFAQHTLPCYSYENGCGKEWKPRKGLAFWTKLAISTKMICREHKGYRLDLESSLSKLWVESWFLSLWCSFRTWGIGPSEWMGGPRWDIHKRDLTVLVPMLSLLSASRLQKVQIIVSCEPIMIRCSLYGILS